MNVTTKRVMVAAAVVGALSLAGTSTALADAQVTARRATPVWEQLPAGGDGFLVWSQNSVAQPNHFDLYARRQGGTPFRVNPPRSQGYAGGLRGTVLVYQLIRGRHSDIRFVDLRTHRARSAPAAVNTNHYEFAPSISGQWLLFTRQLMGSWPVYRVLLFNLATHRTFRLDEVRGPHVYAAAGQVTGDFATWQACSDQIKCEVFRYRISQRHTLGVPNPGAFQYAPSVNEDGTVYFARSGSACGANVRIMRYDGRASPHRVTVLPPGIDVGDTYVVRNGSGREHLLYDHTSCDPFTADIYSIALR
jgi:hypothetical protein